MYFGLSNADVYMKTKTQLLVYNITIISYFLKIINILR